MAPKSARDGRSRILIVFSLHVTNVRAHVCKSRVKQKLLLSEENLEFIGKVVFDRKRMIPFFLLDRRHLSIQRVAILLALHDESCNMVVRI